MVMGFPGGTVVKYLPANAGDLGIRGLIPGSGRSPGGGNDNPFQCSCQVSSMVRGAWQATVHRVPNSQTGLSDYVRTCTKCNDYSAYLKSGCADLKN